MAVETSRGVYITATLIVAGVGSFAFGMGFYVLAGEGAPGTVWQRMCRAAGVGGPLRGASSLVAAPNLTSVVVPQEVSSAGTPEQIGHGATLALRCTVCHGAQGMSRADAPNLAAQYPDVIYKQLLDYQRGARSNPVMTAMAASLSTENVLDLAHYYASLRRELPEHGPADAPALVRVGDPMRNIAPCAACHGAADRKKGAPSLLGEPAVYLTAQLTAFASGARSNDANAVMRSVARGLSAPERDMLANYYAGTPP